MTSQTPHLDHLISVLSDQRPVSRLMVLFRMEAYARLFLTEEGRKVIEQKQTGFIPLLEEIIDQMQLKTEQPLLHLSSTGQLIERLDKAHKKLSANEEDSVYQGFYTLVLPYIVELRSKSKSLKKDEIETCLNALYLSAQKKELGEQLTEQTEKAIEHICSLLTCIEDEVLREDNSNPIHPLATK